MNESPQPRQFNWTNRVLATLVAILAAQVALLWLHGGMLNRQHGEIQAMRQDIQDLTEALDNSTYDQGQDQGQDQGKDRSAPGEGSVYAPAHHRHPHSPGWQRPGKQRPGRQRLGRVSLVLQDNQDNAPDKQDPTMKETQEARESAKKAIADARDIRQKLSIDENIRKADEKKKVDAATSSFLPIVYGAMALGILAFLLGRMWWARSGGR